jgi:hypothetical protein
MGTVHKEQYTFFIISRTILRMRNVSDKICRENQNTNFMFKNFFLENCAIYEMMWKNIVEPNRPQMTIWLMCIACWIPEATDTFRICNTYCCSAETFVAQTCLTQCYIVLALPVLFLQMWW